MTIKLRKAHLLGLIIITAIVSSLEQSHARQMIRPTIKRPHLEYLGRPYMRAYRDFIHAPLYAKFEGGYASLSAEDHTGQLNLLNHYGGFAALGIGKRFQNIRVELEYSYHRHYLTPDAPEALKAELKKIGDIDYYASHFFLNAYTDIKLRQPHYTNLTPYIGMGIGLINQEIKAKALKETHTQQAGYQGIIGMRYNLLTYDWVRRYMKQIPFRKNQLLAPYMSASYRFTHIFDESLEDGMHQWAIGLEIPF